MPSWIRAKVYLVHTPDLSVAKSSIFNSNNFDLSVSIKLVTKQKMKRDPKSRTFQNSGERASEPISGCALKVCVSQGAAPRLARHSTGQMWGCVPMASTCFVLLPSQGQWLGEPASCSAKWKCVIKL